jgi:hypothetical protein
VLRHDGGFSVVMVVVSLGPGEIGDLDSPTFMGFRGVLFINGEMGLAEEVEKI